MRNGKANIVRFPKFLSVMVMLLGAEIFRIRNILDNASSANTYKQIKSQEETQPSSSVSIPASPLAPVTKFSQTEASKLQQEITQMSDQLKQACKARRGFILSNKIKELKEQWALQDRTTMNKTLQERANKTLKPNQGLYEQIAQLKRDRKQPEEDTYIQKNKLKKL